MCTARKPYKAGEDEIFEGPMPIECLTSGSTNNKNIQKVKEFSQDKHMPEENFAHETNNTYYDPEEKIVKMPIRNG